MKIQVNKNKVMIEGLPAIAKRIADIFEGEVEVDVIGKSTFCAINAPKTLYVNGNKIRVMSYIGEISFYQDDNRIRYSTIMLRETGCNRFWYREAFQRIIRQYK